MIILHILNINLSQTINFFHENLDKSKWKSPLIIACITFAPLGGYQSKNNFKKFPINCLSGILPSS